MYDQLGEKHTAEKGARAGSAVVADARAGCCHRRVIARGHVEHKDEVAVGNDGQVCFPAGTPLAVDVAAEEALGCHEHHSSHAGRVAAVL